MTAALASALAYPIRITPTGSRLVVTGGWSRRVNREYIVDDFPLICFLFTAYQGRIRGRQDLTILDNDVLSLVFAVRKHADGSLDHLVMPVNRNQQGQWEIFWQSHRDASDYQYRLRELPRKPIFNQPMWTGEPRPDAITVQLVCPIVEYEELRRSVVRLGYDIGAFKLVGFPYGDWRIDEARKAPAPILPGKTEFSPDRIASMVGAFRFRGLMPEAISSWMCNREGRTISTIAARYGVSAKSLSNCISKVRTALRAVDLKQIETAKVA